MGKDNAPTRFTGGPIPIFGTPPLTGGPIPVLVTATPLLSPFAPAPYALDAPTDGTLQAALDQAVLVAKPLLGPNPVAFALILIAGPGGVHKYAGVRADEMMFSASLVKVGAMYAAFELREAVRWFAEHKGTLFSDPDAFFEAVAAHFDPQINAVALPEVQKVSEALGKKKNLDDPLFGALSTPAYQRMFNASDFGTGVKVDFNFKFLPTDANLFREDLTEMITLSGDPQASRAIARLSYSYISAALTTAGFFAPEADPKESKGIWVGSNYTSGADPFLDFQLKHNLDLAPVTTARQIARFFALIQLDQLVPSETKHSMFKLLQQSNVSALEQVVPLVTLPDGTQLPAAQSPVPPLSPAVFKVVPRKIGVANLLRSEGATLSWLNNPTRFSAKNLTGDVAVCWQNLSDIFTTKDKKALGIAQVITQAVETYLTNA
jgi:hypothetical protein